jgi:hypothetical protein
MMTPIEAIQFRIARTADWRRSLAADYPDDDRNGRAATRLDQLAKADPRGVSTETLAALADQMTSRTMPGAISEAARDVEFRRQREGLDEFLQIVLTKIKRQ